MRVLGISGSPKKIGFTNLLLDESLDGARQGGAHTDKIILNDISFKPCQECFGCLKTGVCVQPDGMDAVYKKMAIADAIIIASPVYFGTISAQLKSMIDRCNSIWAANRLKIDRPSNAAKKGAFICVAGMDKRSYFTNARSIIKILFATLGISYSRDLFVGGVDTLTDNSPKKKEAIQKSYDLGLSLVINHKPMSTA